MENHFRHEYKYLISRQSARLLKLRLPHVLRTDPYAGPSGQYTIRSLYFDDAAFSAYHEKTDGTDHRTKFRIRCYDYSSRVLKLEKKEKHGHLTRKTAQRLSLADVQSLQQNPRCQCPDHPDGLAEAFRLHCASTGARPAVLVDYDRTAFVCPDGNTRITLDENLRTIPYQGNLFSPPYAMIPVLEPDTVILEVKFDDFLPGHLASCLEDIPKIPMAISKFAMCMNLI